MTGPCRGPAAVRAVGRSARRTARLALTGRLARPATLVGSRLAVDDGSTSTVFRETAVRGYRPDDPVLLVVRFRLRWIGRAGWAHAVFRRTCLVNTPLFAGFPGFVTKLWLTDPATGVYRGLYEWDGAAAAEAYATTLARVLALVVVRGSVGHVVVPGVGRNPVLEGLPMPAAEERD